MRAALASLVDGDPSRLRVSGVAAASGVPEQPVGVPCAHFQGQEVTLDRTVKDIYGIPVLKVREIIGMMDITEVPRTPEYIRGVLNLRGKVIPVIDLRLKFGMEAVPQTEETCIIVVEAEGSERGIIVDKVSEVLDILTEDIEETPSFGDEVDAAAHALEPEPVRVDSLHVAERSERGHGRGDRPAAILVCQRDRHPVDWRRSDPRPDAPRAPPNNRPPRR